MLSPSKVVFSVPDRVVVGESEAPERLEHARSLGHGGRQHHQCVAGAFRADGARAVRRVRSRGSWCTKKPLFLGETQAGRDLANTTARDGL
jgi:hypothetical protein